MTSSEPEDDEPLTLPADTLQVLADFHNERDAQEKRFQSLKDQAEAQHARTYSMDLFQEDWNASQFWYTDETADVLADQLLHECDESSAIAVISAPSVYVALKRRCAQRELNPHIVLFEYDKRFDVFGQEYQYYDFQQPLHVQPSLKGRFDRVICDPPFLSEDCQAKTALTTRYLSRSWSSDIRFISCTGERMEAVVHRLYEKLGVGTTTFEPQHRKGLSNEFRCYANFTCNAWTITGVNP